MSARSTSTGTGVVLDSTVSMATLQHRILVAAAPPRVFELLTDPASFPAWKDGVLAVHDAPRPLRTGDAYVATMRGLPIGPTVRCRFEMSHVEHPTGLIQRGRMPAGSTISTDRLRPTDGGTELTFTLEYTVRPGLLWQLADALLLRRPLAATLRRSLPRLKTLAEGA
jgi:uncharacterized protein YndB with AHSA1/START domain